MTSALIVLNVVLVIVTTGVLLLLLAVLRRLREHEERFAQMGEPIAPPRLTVTTGDAVADFTAISTDGMTVTGSDLDGQSTLIAFLSTDCDACTELTPSLVKNMEARRRTGDRSIAVVVGASDSDYAHQFPGTPIISLSSPTQQPAATFGATFYPSYVLIGPDRRVTAGGLLEEHLEGSAQG